MAKADNKTSETSKGAKSIKLKQTGSPIRCPVSQRAILKGLGLGKMNREVELTDTPETRGMIRKVRHMVTVQD